MKKLLCLIVVAGFAVGCEETPMGTPSKMPNAAEVEAKMKEGMEKTKEAAKKVEEKVEEGAKKVEEKVEEGVEKVKEAVQGTPEPAKEEAK